MSSTLRLFDHTARPDQLDCAAAPVVLNAHHFLDACEKAANKIDTLIAVNLAVLERTEASNIAQANIVGSKL